MALPEQIQEVPMHLAHKPLSTLPYFNHDGKWAGDTDVQFLSLGLAQWDPRREVSLKILRHTGEKWSRQAEEIPVPRAIDLVLFLTFALFHRDGKIPPGTFCNQTSEITLTEHNPHYPYGEIRSLDDYGKKNPEELAIVLNRL